ncbi:MAG: tetratricopeptide repeat protein, partial [Sulfuricella denitrificans]|nr:tetratricopeptide repeat protein [Sulfuricella denitrificans]
LGNILRSLKRTAEAAVRYREALELNPDYAKAHNNLGVCLKELKEIDVAAAHFRRAIELEPDFVEAVANLGSSLVELENFDEAIDFLEQALRLKPDFADAHYNLGKVLSTRCEMNDRVIQHYEQAIAASPDLADAHFSLSTHLLLKGDIARGWEEFSWRTRAHKNLSRPFPHPFWQGEPLTGKTLLVWGEQGVGDEILFASVLPDVIRAAKRVIVECEPRLVSLFTRAFPAAEIVPRSDPPHPHTLTADIDWQSPAGNLPRWFRPTLESFPAQAAYLIPDADRVARWKDWLDTLGPGPKVGIAWRSMLSGEHRDPHYTKLTQWSHILANREVSFINLQYDQCQPELESAREAFGVEIHIPPGIDLKDELDEAAALTAALDLVITAGTSVAATSGALGQKTWM